MYKLYIIRRGTVITIALERVKQFQLSCMISGTLPESFVPSTYIVANEDHPRISLVTDFRK